jgi:hypothetical protein
MFQPPPLAKIPNATGPAFRLTVCETVCQFCQPPVDGMLTVPYTGVTDEDDVIIRDGDAMIITKPSLLASAVELFCSLFRFYIISVRGEYDISSLVSALGHYNIE